VPPATEPTIKSQPMHSASIHAFFDSGTSTVTHLVADPATRRAAVIDSVLDYDAKSGRTSTRSADAVIALVRSQGLAVDWLLETHAHADHLSAAPYLQRQLNGKIAIGEHIVAVQRVFKTLFNAADMLTDGQPFDRLLAEGDTFMIGSLEVQVMHTPGHTPACVSYVVGEDVFIGDTLFMPDYGSARCDFPGGNAATLYASVRRLLALPGTTRLHLCHDYPPASRAPCWVTTVAEQRAHNLHLREGSGEAEFVALRIARDRTLEMPMLLLPAIQVNVRAGHLPPPEDNGIRYLKLPLNAL
jgi:glyoxylase-like metal-dependent hydrolase (beta-lactamase superfamily II)